MASERRTTYSVSWLSGITEFEKEAWDRLAEPLASPFLEWGWLAALESSGSIGPGTGWVPRYLSVRRDGRLVGAAPLYVRNGSEGEFVFDYAWADAAEKLGARYYPRLVGMSPATPVTTYRFLIDRSDNATRVEKIMFDAVEKFCVKHRMGGCSLNFTETGWEGPARNGFLSWKHHGFVWKNDGFSSFEDYLAVFNKNQRRNIRRERSSMGEQGFTIRVVTGSEAPDSWFPLMYRYYGKTNEQFGPWAAKYLNGRFFTVLKDLYRERLVFTAAFKGIAPPHGGAVPDDPPVALSLLVRKGKRLFGRYWGSERFYENLYFNVCYYVPIEWAIGEGIEEFDPGMGASLKVRRGFRSVYSLSRHRFTEPVMQKLMASYIDRINRGEQEQIDELNRALPFRKDVLDSLFGRTD